MRPLTCVVHYNHQERKKSRTTLLYIGPLFLELRTLWLSCLVIHRLRRFSHYHPNEITQKNPPSSSMRVRSLPLAVSELTITDLSHTQTQIPASNTAKSQFTTILLTLRISILSPVSQFYFIKCSRDGPRCCDEYDSRSDT